MGKKSPKTDHLMQQYYCLKRTLFICLKTCFIPVQDDFYFTTQATSYADGTKELLLSYKQFNDYLLIK
jgi:hypothetical protein